MVRICTMISKYRRPLVYLVGISLVTKLLMALATIYIFHSFIDGWGFSVYWNTLIVPFLQHGSIPYINYVWEYPPLMLVPTIIAAVVAVAVHQYAVFVYAYTALMIICDCISIVCVYFIALKMSAGNAKYAFTAGFLSATAFSAAYHVITCFDAFPVCLMMLGLFFAIGEYQPIKSYGALVCGYFAKLFPAILIPFVFLYNLNRRGWKGELKSLLKVSILLALVFAVPFILLNFSSIGVYLDQTETGKGVFAATLTYTIYAWLHRVFMVAVTPAVLTPVMYAILGIVMMLLVWCASYIEKMKPKELLKLSLLALVSIIIFVPHHSPQYMMWFIPILSILVAGNVWKMLWFYLFQVIEYIKFPLAFYGLYTNGMYTEANWMVALMFFTIEFAVLFYLVWIAVMPFKIFTKVNSHEIIQQ